MVELTAEEIDLLARLEHRRWLIERRLLGWRYGSKHSESKRINPLLVEWEKLPEVDKQQRRKETADLPDLLAGAGYVLRRVHLIRAYGDWLATASKMMEGTEAHTEQCYNVVLAEIDRPEGIAIAERAIKLPSTSLWLVSHEDPLALARSLNEDLAHRCKILIEKADGWTRCNHLVASPFARPENPEKPTEIAARAMPSQLRSVT